MTKTPSNFHVQPEGYHDADDARRMQQLAQAMLSERRHLALSSPDPETLAHYSRLLVRDLRRSPGIQVLAHLPSTSEILLEHVNQLLADLPISQGVDRQAAPARPPQVLVLHDTPQLTTEALSLLVRLINDLPGANLRLVLVQGRDMAVSESLRALGPQLLHWHILPPGMSAAEAASAERAREALREAMRQDTGSASAARSRAATTAASSAAGSVSPPSWVKRPAPQLAAKARSDKPEPTPALRARSDAKHGAKRGSKHTTTSTATVAARRNWILLSSGLALSAALAVALGLWISTHSPAPKQMTAARAGPATTR